MKYRVCHEQDVPPGEMRSYMVKNIPIIVVHSKKDKFYALYRFCPHQRSDLGKGVLAGLTAAAQPGGEVQYVREGEILRCPWHGFSFDVTDGTCLSMPERLRVKTYPVEVANQEVFLEL